MRWLIVEDSLESRRGHWYEYVSGFMRVLPTLGDEVKLLVSRRAEPFILETLEGKPVLPDSAFAKMSDGAAVWRRYLRIPVHAWRTYLAMGHFLRNASAPEVIFVPTVTLHHLLGWYGLMKTTLRHSSVRVILFFPGLPVRTRESAAQPDGSPTAWVCQRLLRRLAAEIASGKVVLGVETQTMKAAGEQAFGMPFTYFPHPVAPLVPKSAVRSLEPVSLIFGSYGGARHEKGADLLVAAVTEYCRRHPDSQARFALQCVGGDEALWKGLLENPRVELIRDYFAAGEYARRLQATAILLLPYRRSSYALRISRVAIEAMVNGIPMVATSGTTLADDAREFGAAVLSEDENVESLVRAIEAAERNHDTLAAKARERMTAAQEHFSVMRFRAALGPR